MDQKEMLKEKIDQAISNAFVHPMFNKTTIKFAQKGNDAGLLGALYNFKNKNSWLVGDENGYFRRNTKTICFSLFKRKKCSDLYITKR